MAVTGFWGRLAPAVVLVGGMMLAGAAFAQSPSQESLDQGATTGLGASHRFASITAAETHCPGDTIVWSSGVDLSYRIVQSSSQPKGHGFFACKMEADSAGFHQVP